MVERGSPIDALVRITQVACFGDRLLPLPNDLREQLARDAEAAFEYTLVGTDSRSQHEIAEDLLIHAAKAAVRYPQEHAAYEALRQATSLICFLRKPEEPPHQPTSWEERAGLMGGG